MFVPFSRTLTIGRRGNDVLAVKKALKSLGRGGFTMSNVYGKYVANAVKEFQRDAGVTADGIYGPITHRIISAHFTAAMTTLYESALPTKQLPENFFHTHDTAGLPGYPAIDILVKPGTIGLAPAAGKIIRFSGHGPSGRAIPGGPYGLSMYLLRDKGGEYFITHLGKYMVKVGQRVKRGDPLGTAVDFEAATHGVTPSHFHEGFTLAK